MCLSAFSSLSSGSCDVFDLGLMISCNFLVLSILAVDVAFDGLQEDRERCGQIHLIEIRLVRISGSTQLQECFSLRRNAS